MGTRYGRRAGDGTTEYYDSKAALVAAENRESAAHGKFLHPDRSRGGRNDCVLFSAPHRRLNLAQAFSRADLGRLSRSGRIFAADHGSVLTHANRIVVLDRYLDVGREMDLARRLKLHKVHCVMLRRRAWYLVVARQATHRTIEKQLDTSPSAR